MCVNTGCSSCSGSCGCNCQSCSSNQCDSCTSEPCGCASEHDFACVRYGGCELECLGLVEGQTLEQAFHKLDKIVCELNPGVDGTDGIDGIGITWLGSLAVAPVAPNLNDAYYDTVLGTSYIWNGFSWQILAVDGADGIDGTDGISINWLGSLAVAPVAPNLNDAYYDTVLGTSYIWNGFSWQIVAIDGTDGIDGTNGTNGTNGADSTVPGPPGINGTDGIDGADGTNGTNGTDGTNGADGGPANFQVLMNSFISDYGASGSLTPVIVTGTSYTVPVGGGGYHEFLFSGTFTTTSLGAPPVQTERMYIHAGVYVNGIIVEGTKYSEAVIPHNSSWAGYEHKIPFAMYGKKILFNDGDIIDIRMFSATAFGDPGSRIDTAGYKLLKYI